VTPAHRGVLAFVAGYYREHQLPPAVRDVAAARGISVGTAHRLITDLTEDGYLERRPFRSSVSYWPTERAVELLSA
jgi:DNA-binding IclR family transcriptional regulator